MPGDTSQNNWCPYCHEIEMVEGRCNKCFFTFPCVDGVSCNCGGEHCDVPTCTQCLKDGHNHNTSHSIKCTGKCCVDAFETWAKKMNYVSNPP